jgi:hypothetical protein
LTTASLRVLNLRDGALLKTEETFHLIHEHLIIPRIGHV